MRTDLIKNKEEGTSKTSDITKEEGINASSGSTDGMLDMVIAFDTTGSMSCYIESVKKYVTELIPKLLSSNPKLKIGIVAFGDYCDMPSKQEFS